MENKNYYKILQVDPSAESTVIEGAYKRLSQKYHPDKNKSSDATRRMQEINEAYEVLSDPAKRAQYDRGQSSQSSYEAEEQRKREEAEAAHHRAAEEQQRKERDEAERRRAEYEQHQREKTEVAQRQAEYERQRNKLSLQTAIPKNWGSIALAPTGGLIGAIIGGVLWAKIIQWTGFTAGAVAIAIGILTGLGVLLTGRSRKVSVSLVAALFAIVGILFGKYLDVRWNAPKAETVAIIDAQKGIPPDYAESIAKTIEASESGGATWKLMRNRMEWFDLLYYAVAAFVAFRIAYSKLLHHYFVGTES